MEWLNIGTVVLFLAWGALCFWVGRKPQQAAAVAAELKEKAGQVAQAAEAKVNDLMGHMKPGANPLDSYADAMDMAMSIGASGYPGQVELDGKIVKSGTTPGVRYVSTVNGVTKV